MFMVSMLNHTAVDPAPTKVKLGTAAAILRPHTHATLVILWRHPDPQGEASSDGRNQPYAKALPIDSRHWPLPAVAFPFGALFALVGQTNPQAPILDPKVQMEVLSTSLQAHPPMIVSHLLQMNESAMGHNFVKGGPSIFKPPLEPYFNRTGVVLPNHVAIRSNCIAAETAFGR
jgi:hypothetical protein